jgi:hypothetical protein
VEFLSQRNAFVRSVPDSKRSPGPKAIDLRYVAGGYKKTELLFQPVNFVESCRTGMFRIRIIFVKSKDPEGCGHRLMLKTMHSCRCLVGQ